MTWTAPEVQRARPPRTGDERDSLEGFLDYHRDTLLLKCAGLTAEDLKRASVEPSGLTLLGLVRHMTEVEQWWFSVRAAGLAPAPVYCTYEFPDGDFDLVAEADAETDLARFRERIGISKAAVAELPLEHEFTHPRHGELSLRWVYLHMLEEYARHNGHADLLRERIDGATGE
jgi:uncharacterized protein DUF664